MTDLPIIKKSYMAKLGDFTFEINSALFSKWDRQSNFRWATLQRLFGMPVDQFLGPDQDTISISGRIYPHFKGGLGQVAKLRSMANAGKPYLLIATDARVGENLGLWTIRSIKELRESFFDNGVPQQIDFTAELKAYGEAA